jgi:enoyl-[acyl-carrier protein] reductase II
MSAKVADIIDGGATVFVAGLGVPREVVDQCHEGGLLVMNMCGKVAHAVAAVEAGCDVVVAQGTEAGGHTGQVATMALVPQIVDAVGDRVPVVAAGGLFDGRGLAAALALGADGVWIGTRFIATPEARAVAGYKERLLEAAEDGTVVTRAYTGKTCRVLRTSYVDEFERAGGVAEPFPGQYVRSLRDGVNHLGGDEDTPGVDPEREFMPAGQGVGAIDELVPAGELVERFVREAEATLDRVAQLRS